MENMKKQIGEMVARLRKQHKVERTPYHEQIRRRVLDESDEGGALVEHKNRIEPMKRGDRRGTYEKPRKVKAGEGAPLEAGKSLKDWKIRKVKQSKEGKQGE